MGHRIPPLDPMLASADGGGHTFGAGRNREA